MTSISRIRFILSYILLFFLVRDIFAKEAAYNDDGILKKCGVTCIIVITVVSVLILGIIAYIILRKKYRHRQKTGYTEEVPALKYDDFNTSFESINIQPVFQRAHPNK
ncbi:15691_t:CDS:2 [Funneliformis mosseae]|uniref:15691_t:CDS:1 n=1 Tax=Funneliformis mosseae TaxID=27381 RepID=A0A9N8VM62_FUNMO|nr:15691_t:CDS:2 [Funneliformis mosseae]